MRPKLIYYLKAKKEKNSFQFIFFFVTIAKFWPMQLRGPRLNGKNEYVDIILNKRIYKFIKQQ
jgi:hypothetical protein